MRQHSAEDAYLFRHAMLREAAYQLQPPLDRALLHAAAFTLVEAAYGGPAPELPPPVTGRMQPMIPHRTDAVALELASHAELAQHVDLDIGMANAARRYIHRAACLATEQFRFHEAIGLWRRLAERLSGQPMLIALSRCGTAAKEWGDAALARRTLEELHEKAWAAGDQHMQGIALGELAQAMTAQGDLVAAEAAVRESIAMLRVLAVPRSLAASISGLANLLWRGGHADSAQALWREALELLAGQDPDDARAAILNNLAGCFGRLGNTAQAEPLFRQAMDIHQAQGQRHAVELVRMNLANLFAETGRVPQALTIYRQSVQALSGLGHRRLEGVALANLAAILFNTGEKYESEDLLLKAIAIHHEVGDNQRLAHALSTLMAVYQNSGRHELALATGQQTLELCRALGLKSDESTVLYNLASMAVDQKQLDQACALFEQAIAMQRQIGLPVKLAGSLCNYMHALLLLGRIDEARAAWLEGAALLKDFRDIADLKNKQRTMQKLCVECGIEPFGMPVRSGPVPPGPQA
ncbi:MAG: tetratricopeptide repeat protein [Planctomycetes bacterium]|nr:tetratricopeptide repeat protein [Planctomycetota bacterium]